jgi:hypothetical protein
MRLNSREMAKLGLEIIKTESNRMGSSADYKEENKTKYRFAQALYMTIAGWILSTGLIILVPEAASAGCSNGSGTAHIFSKKDESLIYFIGEVSTYGCVNQGGSFAGYEFKGESTGWKICYKNCNMPSLQGKLIVRINGVDLEGGVVKKIAGGYCISEKAKDAQYCWSASSVE